MSAPDPAEVTMAMLVERVAAATGATVVHTRIPPWLQEVLAPHNAAVAAGALWCCEHLNADPPPPVVMAAWKPGLLVCPVCAGAGALNPDTAQEAQTCDRCRLHLPGQIRPVTLRLGPLLVLTGLCRADRAEFEEAAGLGEYARPAPEPGTVAAQVADAMRAELHRLTAAPPGTPR